jgi:hypothetical protein
LRSAECSQPHPRSSGNGAPAIVQARPPTLPRASRTAKETLAAARAHGGADSGGARPDDDDPEIVCAAARHECSFRLVMHANLKTIRAGGKSTRHTGNSEARLLPP